MKTKFLVIALALPLVFGCEKSDVDDNGGKDNTEQGGNAGGYDPDKDDPMTDLPPLEDVDDVCTKMVDRDFMTYCYDNFDVNKDGKVSMLEANAQSNGGLVIECNTAADFTGIEYFTNLTKFKSSSVRTLNLGYNKKLVSIDCSDSPLEAIDLRYNTLVSEISFRDCWKLTKVLFADEAPLESVGGNRFSGCSSLSTLSLPDNCKTIGEKAFYKFTNLSKIKFPKNLESIGSSAFSGCSGLTSVTFPDGLTSIGDFAFSSCSGLTSVTFPDSLTSMGRSAFSGCPGKFYGKGALSDNMVVVIDDILFCASIAISGNYVVPNCKAIGSSAFSDCSGLTSVTFPDGLTSISDFAFMGCSGLTSVTFPDGLTTIGDYAFCDCRGLTSVTFPDGLTTIGDYAFRYCWGLISVVFPESLTQIGLYSFLNSSPVDVKVLAVNPPVQYGAFEGISSSAVLYVPTGCVDTYKSSDWGKYFKTIVEIEN